MLMEDGTQLHAEPVRLGPITRIESFSGTLHVLQPGKLILFDGKVVNKDFIDWGTLPSSNTKDMLSFGNRMFIITDRGLAVWTTGNPIPFYPIHLYSKDGTPAVLAALTGQRSTSPMRITRRASTSTARATSTRRPATARNPSSPCR